MPRVDLEALSKYPKLERLLAHKLAPKNMPQKTQQVMKFANNMLYQFLDFQDRQKLNLNRRPQHILPSDKNHLKYLD